MEIKCVAALLVVAAALLAAAGSAQQVPTCATKLIPCAPYLNSTKPPDACCGPLKETVKDETACLCSLFNNTALLKTFNIDLNQVFRLPKACGINADQSICKKPGASGSGASSSSSTSPPANVSATPRGNSANSARGAARIGMSGLASLFLFWWSVVA